MDILGTIGLVIASLVGLVVGSVWVVVIFLLVVTAIIVGLVLWFRYSKKSAQTRSDDLDRKLAETKEAIAKAKQG